MEYSEATRNALVESAVDLFTEHGYTGTSLDEIARRARVTKGALYHHFAGKQGLFEAVFEAVESRVVERISATIHQEESAWDTMASALGAFLQVCLEPSYQRIVVREGPAVMGWERWRETEERLTFGLVRDAIRILIDSGEIEALPEEALSQVVFGAMSAGAISIAGATDPERTSVEVGQCLKRVMVGLRTTPCR